jgi:hypothetical protein
MNGNKTHDLHVLIGAGCILGAIAVISLATSLISVHFDTTFKQALLNSQRLFVPKPFTFPDGGRELTGKYRMVALYGTIDSPALGLLGEQPVDESIKRARDMAASYRPYTSDHIYPAFEIITTTASEWPTDDGDYSQESDPKSLRPWVDAAKQNGVYVVLDLQPGREDFLSQAKLYESLLREPHVGLALDPEWRLGPDQVHLNQIGSVSVDEVNATSQWLSDLTRRRKLPQKLLLLHQFRTDMINGRERLQSRPNVATIVQMDGQGDQPGKTDTWNALVAQPPAGMQFGWKNFIDEDKPMLSPEQTMQRQPQPWYVSYQ